MLYLCASVSVLQNSVNLMLASAVPSQKYEICHVLVSKNVILLKKCSKHKVLLKSPLVFCRQI